MWRSKGTTVLVAALGFGIVSVVSYACWLRPRPPAAAERRALERSTSQANPSPAPSASAIAEPRDPAYARLEPLRITNANSHETLEVRLYDDTGRVDQTAARKLDQLLCDARDKKHFVSTEMNRRTLQLFFKAAYHFKVREAEVISGYRKPGRHREGHHATGRAIDFKLGGVPAAELGSYLRKEPRVGVGVYTHPKTQYVHLDVRDQSYHWLDASPPRRRWRERSLGRIPKTHDDAYTPESDWPEGTTPPRL